MIPKNPIVFVTIPLALALGLIWFRRKKCHCDTGGIKKASSKSNLARNSSPNGETEKEISDKCVVDLKHSISLPIGSTPKKLASSALNNNESFDFKFGKSAPIDITPHKTSPKRNGSDTKDEPALNSIEENSLDSVDLPGSVNCRRRFSFTIKTNEPTVVVKATKMDVEKSPQSSFETLTTTSPPTSTSNKLEAIMTTDVKNSSEKKVKNEKLTNGNTSMEKNEKESSRIMPIASPPLSLCSNKSNQSHESGDSGKGSSPPNSEGGQTLSSIQSYDFELPHSLVGCLLGKSSSHIKKVQQQCGVTIAVKRHPIKYRKYTLCTIQGTQKQIDDALAMIKTRMPQRANLQRIDLEIETAEMLAAASAIDVSLLQVNF